MSGILMDLSLPSVDTIMCNSRVLFAEHLDVSCDKIVQRFATIILHMSVFICTDKTFKLSVSQ